MAIEMPGLQDFPMLRLRVVWSVEEGLHLRGYAGGALRGAFGAALRREVCARPDDGCGQCEGRGDCPFVRLFRTSTLNPLHAAPQRATPPAPMVLEPPLRMDRPLSPGEELHMQLVLVGRAIADLGHVAAACERMGEMGLGNRRSRLGLLHVDFVHARGYVVAYMPGASECAAPPFEPTLASIAPAGQATSDGTLTVQLVTPLRLRSRGRLRSDLSLGDLVDAALWRVSLLAQHHMDGPAVLDHDALCSRAQQCRVVDKHLEWIDWATDSRSQGRLQLGGLVGHLAIEGQWQELLPLLRLAEQVHLGKNATYGLGKIVVEG